MHAAVVSEAGRPPRYAEFREPSAQAGEVLVSVRAAALSPLAKGRASGRHYSADGSLPMVAGVDGVGLAPDGRRVYFALPEAPFGAMAERTRVQASHCIEVPQGLDDITAAAIANPGMSAWAALAIRARIQPGDTVLIHGATGTAGRLAVPLAKYLGASKVIATARRQTALDGLEAQGADVTVAFDVDANPQGAKAFEEALGPCLAQGVDVVVDYLWGKSAEVLIAAIARAAGDASPVRFVHVGAASGADITLPGAALRSSGIVLMGSGLRSVPLDELLGAVGHVYDAVQPASLRIATRAVPLAAVETAWNADTGGARTVFVIDGA